MMELDEKSGYGQSHQDSSSGDMNVCSKFHGNPSRRCRDILMHEKCQHASGTRGKVMGPSKSLGRIVWESGYLYKISGNSSNICQDTCLMTD